MGQVGRPWNETLAVINRSPKEASSNQSARTQDNRTTSNNFLLFHDPTNCNSSLGIGFTRVSLVNRMIRGSIRAHGS